MFISDALGEEIPLEVAFPKDSLNVVYRPAEYTVAELEELTKSEKDPKRIVTSMLRLLVSWDLKVMVDNEPMDVPLEFEAMRTQVPTNIFMKILRAVNADQNPGESERP
jgi:hypothetical protein